MLSTFPGCNNQQAAVGTVGLNEKSASQLMLGINPILLFDDADTVIAFNDIKNAIVAVNKTSGGGSADTSDLLWILSGREVGFTGSAFASSGPVYSQIFTDNASRKNDSTYSHGYWLRDAHYDISDGAGWKIVSSDGYETVSPTYWSSYILFGFCI